MKKLVLRTGLLFFVGLILAVMLWLPSGTTSVFAQRPTVDLPTVTSTPGGPTVRVKLENESQINIRSGPGYFYDKVGVLLAGQVANAKGRSAGGDWILIEYPGIPGGLAWVYSPLVDLSPGSLPIVEPPPTPTPIATITIDPTLAAQFVVTAEVTRLPTFTAPPPLVIPTFQDNSPGTGTVGGIPMGLIIVSLAAIGVLVGVFSLAQGR